MNLVSELNLAHAEAKQEGKCHRCNADYTEDRNRDRVFYWLDKDHNELYCEKCGLQIMEETK